MTQIHAIRDWHIYLCQRCNASNPPKDKFVVVVYKYRDTAYGFFINSEIPRFIQANPGLLKEQLAITPQGYKFLDHPSTIGCNDLKSFFAWELKPLICPVNSDTIAAILEIANQSETLDPEQKQRILDNRP